MKIYTRTGDDGSTALFGGARVGKDDVRVEAYGTVDEANSALGLARTELVRGTAAGTVGGATGAAALAETLDADLAALQSLLFDLGADLATPMGTKTREFVRPVDAEDVARIEEMIDHYTLELPALTHFILPGGTAAAAALHMARSIIRRAERSAVTLARTEEVGEQVLLLLNRLSDLFFTLARVACLRAGVSEVVWEARRPERPRR
ncbi:MAG TPA: cob(I)yrinic acid a,c-diamide adenosyltransferase [Trueperaceae bacterium]|nr:cob(I)yrinic acid a,c-diamide adenosyltransferase [Trueperaceae bacterium]